MLFPLKSVFKIQCFFLFCSKLISEVLGFNFYRSFCLASGEYKPGNPEFPLYNCDFYGSKAAGDLMK